MTIKMGAATYAAECSRSDERATALESARQAIWPYSPEAAAAYGVIFAELRRTGRVIQQIDMQIASSFMIVLH